MSQRSAVTDDWIIRVLGIRIAAPGGDAAARLAAARPAEAPQAALTGNLLAALARAAPEAAADLPAILAGLVPRFLLALESEPHMVAETLAEGSAVPAPDQVLSVADGLNAVLRSARRWEALLDQAEQADGDVDRLEKRARDAAQQTEYEALVTSYNATRVAALAEETRCQQLVAALAAEFRAAQAAAR